MEETLNTSVYNKALLKYFKKLWVGNTFTVLISAIAMILIYIGFGLTDSYWDDWRILLPPAILGVLNLVICKHIYRKLDIKGKRMIVALFYSIMCMIFTIPFKRLSYMAFVYCVPIICVIPCGKKTINPTFWFGEILGSAIYLGHQIGCHFAGFAYPDLGLVLGVYVIALTAMIATYLIALSISELFRYTVEETERYARQAEKNYQRATHDPLTGAYNKEKIKIDLAKYEFVSVAFVDLDDFKHFNTDYSHEVGDGVLKCLVECLEEELGSTGRVYRYGGDEFTVLGFAPKTAIYDAIQNAAKDFKSNIWLKFKAEGSFSAGITTYDSNISYSENIDKADKLMYEVKENGKDRILLG